MKLEKAETKTVSSKAKMTLFDGHTHHLCMVSGAKASVITDEFHGQRVFDEMLNALLAVGVLPGSVIEITITNKNPA